MKLHGDRQAFSANLAVRCATFAVGALSLCSSAVLAALLAVAPVSAQAQASKVYRDDTPVADQAITSHEWALAIAELDKRIASQPRDVQARFKRATLLARLGRDQEAIAALTQITQNYPELPEPYNNLAALYAKHGQYQEARATLETALAANPNFALARRNLGDIYLRLALDTYQRAVRQNPTDRLATARADAIRSVVSGAPANSRALARPLPLAAASTPETNAEPINARGLVPGGQSPTILPGSNGSSPN